MQRILFVMLLAWARLWSREISLVTLQYPPYEFQEGTEVRGLAVDVVREAFTRMGHTVKIQVLPWPRALWMVETGAADGIFTMYRTRDRERWADFCDEELISQSTALFGLKGSGIRDAGELKALAEVPIGVVAKVSYGQKFDEAVRNHVLQNVLESSDGEINFRQLLAGRVRLVASNRLGAEYILQRLGKASEVEELKPPLSSVSSYLAFSKKRKLGALKGEFDRTLRAMKADGTWSRLMWQTEP